MKDKAKVLAFDFGASSGRGILATYEEGGLRIEEIHRFENNPVEQDGHLRWDFPYLISQVKVGIEKAGAFDSIGFDTWGVDFGLLDKDGRLMELPVHYRDGRTDGMVERALQRMDADTLYAATGTQIMQINSLFQLLAIKEQRPALLEKADSLLFMPDLFAYHVSGEKVCEQTIASTAQMLDLTSKAWSDKVLNTFALPKNLFARPVSTGCQIGKLENDAKVISVAGHDTQCAVAAIPADEADVAFLSCGTWSLLGCELDAPILTKESRALGLSNELGANGKINYLKNIIGLWLVQESRREWKRQGHDYGYADLAKLAQAEPALQSFINPDDTLFTPPGDLPGRVQGYCKKTNQPIPQSVGQVMRCIYESLALKYRFALQQLEQVTGKHFKTLHVLGGGAQDGFLCQLTADCTGRNVVAGPIEATALGNILIQLVSLGVLHDLDEGRRMLARTETLKYFQPRAELDWQEAYDRFVKLL